MVDNHWLVVTGAMEFYDFPDYWECHQPDFQICFIFHNLWDNPSH